VPIGRERWQLSEDSGKLGVGTTIEFLRNCTHEGRGNRLIRNADMDFSSFQAELRRIGGTVQAFAAIGAALRLRHANQQADPAVQAWLVAAVEATLSGALDGLSQQQVSDALAYVTFQIGEATDLFHHADRPPGWVLRDPASLQGLGDASRQNVRSIVALAADRPRLAASLAGRFLDIGTGVGGMALEAAEQCPSLRVVGIDIWEPSLALARMNAAASPHAERIEIRAQDVTQLDEPAAYTLAWLPTPFMRRPVGEVALDHLAAALVSNGHLVVGLYAIPTDKVGAALMALRIVRNGGYVWDIAEIEQQLRARGFVDVETCVIPPTTFVIGRRP
jgi:precorrin-6B methylase 2